MPPQHALEQGKSSYLSSNAYEMKPHEVKNAGQKEDESKDDGATPNDRKDMDRLGKEQVLRVRRSITIHDSSGMTKNLV
jgi:hypothetical protein